MKHGKYSKTKEVKPYKLTVIIKRYDGTIEDDYYFTTKEKAEIAKEFFKNNEPKVNEYYFGTDYKIEFIGTEKKI